MRRAYLPIIGVALIGAFSAAAGARDLGVRGAVWPPVEADLLASIEDTLLEFERTGELARLNEEAAARARERVEAPVPVPGILPATTNRTRLFDPSITVGEDILGPGGTTIATAGTRVNPLAYRPLTGALLFIDGTRPVEVQWALGQETPSKIVLLAGRPLELARTHERPFFYDQAGTLAERFGLSATPSRVTQYELRLRIEEIVLLTAGDPPGGAGAEPSATDAGSKRIGQDEEKIQ